MPNPDPNLVPPNPVLLFGKLPAHGDFVSRGLAPAERDMLDDWLSASLARARDEMGAAFADRYDRAPPWRCGLTIGDSVVAGALAPSQDSAGRRFPLLLASRGGGEDMAAACEALLYDAISGGWSADLLVERVGAIAGPGGGLAGGSEGDADEPRWWTPGGEGFDRAMLDGDHPADLLSAMLRPAETAI